MIDVKKALTDPSAVFKRPQEVIETSDLSREQKIEILRRWEYDVRELQVADEEGMAPADPQPVVLDSILNALRTLGVPTDIERSAPTKQGGDEPRGLFFAIPNTWVSRRRTAANRTPANLSGKRAMVTPQLL